MLLPFSWLRELINTEKTDEQLCELLNSHCLEAKIVGGANFQGVIVAKIISATQHPNADKLRVCEVFDGKQTLQIVCGAPNARAGIRVALSQVGAILPENFVIKKSKIRDVESFGMLCSARELGLSGDSTGIIELDESYEIGSDFSKYIEKILEVDLTPNRGDCTSVLGITREFLTNDNIIATENFKKINEIGTSKFDSIPVSTEIKLDVDGKLAPKYTLTKISNINNHIKTPEVITNKLIASGLTSKNLLVDIANFVMIELGQPLHTFDFAKISPNISVRMSKGEEVNLLKNQVLKLDDKSIVVANGNDVICLAGILGGENSAISLDTKEILLESAHFSSNHLSNKYGITSDAGYRFARGVDASLPEKAVSRFIELLESVDKNIKVIEKAIFVDEKTIPKDKEILLTTRKLHQILGVEFDEGTISKFLGKLFKITSKNPLKFLVSTNRPDITTETDLVEEFIRLYGYNNLSPDPLLAPISFSHQNQNDFKNRATDILRDNGFSETINYSFLNDQYLEKKAFSVDKSILIKLENPITALMNTMRPSLVPSLFKNIETNVKYSHQDLKLFEIGKAYTKESEKWKVALSIFYPKSKKSWHQKEVPFDIYQLKSIILLLNPNVKFKETKSTLLLDCLEISYKGQPIGILGEVSPKHLPDLIDNKAKLRVFMCEMDLIDSVKDTPAFKQYSEFPIVYRDFSLVVPRDKKYSDIEKTIKKSGGQSLKEIALFDSFTKDGIHSLAIRIIWQNSTSTITDTEADKFSNEILTSLEKEGIKLKKFD